MRSKCLGALSAVLSITALLPLSCASYLSFAPEVGQSGLRIIEMRRIALLLCVILLPLLRKKLLPFFVRRLEALFRGAGDLRSGNTPRWRWKRFWSVR